MRSVNPATGTILTEYPDHDDAELARRLAASTAAFPLWRSRSFAERGAVVRATATRLRARRDELARLMTLEMGKPIAQAEAEVEKCAWVCEHFAQHAEHDLAPQPVASDATRSYVRCDPLGAVLAVMPWNFPFWQVFRCAAPALMAGNVVLLKHASNVPGCALAIEDVFREAGLPPGAFVTLLVPAAAVPGIVAHDAVAAVSLTGSEPAGAAVAAVAGHALKKCVLELGGSDPFIVLADADVERVAPAAVNARLLNNGQSCIAAKRFIVEAPLYDRFAAAFMHHMRSATAGDPLDRTVTLGPLARPDLRDELHAQVTRSVAAGAVLLAGGTVPGGPGAFYPATVLGEVQPGMAAFEEETFGPVAALIRARNAQHAVALANRSRYALGASVWSADAAKAEGLARDIEAGQVFVNGIVKSDPRLPFGGIKRSGYGRELSAVGIREFVNLKTVWVA
jgi:succinate-semialdehyde dehydrogenase / glutarate-semialdehyde dehydrogenase